MKWLFFLLKVQTNIIFVEINSLVNIITNSLNSRFPMQHKCIYAVFIKIRISSSDESLKDIFNSCWIFSQQQSGPNSLEEYIVL